VNPPLSHPSTGDDAHARVTGDQSALFVFAFLIDSEDGIGGAGPTPFVA
jgi:hypothetical protein